MLLAIIDEPESLAMKALDQLGVDAVEIRHGIQGRGKIITDNKEKMQGIVKKLLIF